jgi:hypothetical protein
VRGSVCRATPPYGVTNVADVGRLASSRSVPSRATARLVGVDFGRAWLTLELVRILGLCADADAAVAASACTGAPRRWCSCASLPGFYSVVDDVTLSREIDALEFTRGGEQVVLGAQDHAHSLMPVPHTLRPSKAPRP